MREMKHSGIEWIGEIPEKWEVKRFNYIVKIREDMGLYNEGERFLGLENIESWSGRYIETESKYSDKQADIYCKDDILFSKLRPYLAKSYYAKEDGFCTGEFLVIKDFCGDKKYLYYFFLSPNFIDIVNSSTYGTKMPRANWDFIRNLKIPLPQHEEQTAITAFLEAKCKQIDSLIEIIEKTITELYDYKNQLAVWYTSKGLTKNSKNKPSSIDWIGEVPEHWEILPLFAIFKERKTKNRGMVEKNLLSLSYGNIVRKDISTDTGLLPENFEGYNIIEQGDIVLRLTDLQNDHTSLRTGLSRERGIITSAYITIYNFLDANPDYLRYLLHAADICKIFYNLGSGIRQNLTFEGLKKMQLVLPPKKEQDCIVAYLLKKYKEVDELMAIKQQKITELKEYKKSLIYLYVTGKKEVPA